MSRRVRVEMAVELDLDSPMEVVAMAQEVKAQARPDQWEAMVLLSSAVVELCQEGLIRRLTQVEAVIREQRATALADQDPTALHE